MYINQLALDTGTQINELKNVMERLETDCQQGLDNLPSPLR